MAFKSLTNVGGGSGFSFSSPASACLRRCDALGGGGAFGPPPPPGGGFFTSLFSGGASGGGGGGFTSLTNVSAPEPALRRCDALGGGGDFGPPPPPGGFFTSLFSGGGGGGGASSGGGGFTSLTNVSAPAPTPYVGGRRRGSILKVGGSAVCGHHPSQRTFFASEVKSHDGLLQKNACFESLVYAMTYGDMAPGTRSAAPNRNEVVAMAQHIYITYALANPALCAQLMELADELVFKLQWAQRTDEQNVAQGTDARPVGVPVLGGGGGNNIRLRSGHLPAAVFMQSQLRLACAMHPAT